MNSVGPANSLDSGVRRGSALVIVLAFIVLTAIVLLSYLASTHSSLKKSASSEAMALTQFLGKSATAAVLDDLRQEMLAGADGTSLPAEGEPMTVSQPWAMVPGRVLSSGINASDSNFVNLIKQSVGGKPFYPGAGNPASYSAKGGAVPDAGRMRASMINTSVASRNERVLSPARWNTPMLLGGAGFVATNQLPDWILISRAGPLKSGVAPGDYANKASANDDYVIGRFAYNIYDIGGLLDVNVAGFDPSSTEGLTNAAGKGSSAWADLRAIPGVQDPAELIRWRNKLSASSASSYLSMVRDWGEPRGFLKSFRQGSRIENRFFSRQDLLKYARTYGTNALTTDALPFLTTFSVDTDRSSFTPDPNRPKVQRNSAQGGNDAFGNDSVINPALLSAKNADGESAIKRRFPLERLKYLTPDPDAQTAAKIQEYFGLIWNASERGWNYRDGNQIKRLTEISGRQPNFFELLQGSIGAGSVGGQYQLSDDIPSVSPRVLGRRDGSVSNQIIQIGANIIDQYDEDSYPTAITFSGRTFYGIEDLPYLFGIRITAYHQGAVLASELSGVSVPSGGVMPVRCAVMLQPTLWNPHAPGTTPAAGPSQFRVVAAGDVYPAARVGWWSGAGTRYYVTDSSIPGVYPYPSTNMKDRTPQVVFDPAVDQITFQVSGSALFREACTITSRNYPAGSNSDGATAPINDSVFNQAVGESRTEALGFLAGYMWAGPAVGATRYFENGITISSEGLDFVLQYKDKDGQWRTYDNMESVPPFSNIFQDNATARRPRSWARLDPRSDRFGYRNFLYTVDSQWPQGQSFRPAAATGLTGFGDAPAPDSGATGGGNTAAVNFVAARPGAWALVSENKPGQSVRYSDPDGVLRLAMGGYSNGLTGLPMATNNPASRPVVLNRPFRSVAEVGYAFRGTPWKQIDFFTPESGDAALLDVFCLYEPLDSAAAPKVAGRINLNTRRSEVVQALLRGVALSAENSSASLTTDEVKEVADKLVAWTGSSSADAGPLRNRGELVNRFVTGSSFAGFSTNAAMALSTADQPIAFRRQSVIRGLVDAGTTRTWTFLIDLIVQKGRYPLNTASLDKFSVEGEQRYWVCIAMDRFTGEVISQTVEEVNE